MTDFRFSVLFLMYLDKIVWNFRSTHLSDISQNIKKIFKVTIYLVLNI